MPDLKGLLGRLVTARVRFVVVGGYAAVAHGSSLMTLDVDVCCEMTPANLLRLQAALDGLRPVHRMTPRRVPLRLTPEGAVGWKNLYLDTAWGQLDCLGEVKGIGGYPECRKRSVRVRLGAGSCRVLALEALIQAKRAMGRPRDLETVAQLRAIRARSAERPSTTLRAGSPPPTLKRTVDLRP
jgi:hypothetical protein